jgi:hypothetical protein
MAGAWAVPQGHTQIIVKAEVMGAEDGFDPDGLTAPLFADLRNRALGAFVERGLTDRLTLQIKAEYQDGGDAYVAYEGQGPVEIGVRWQAWRDERTAVSLYAGYAHEGVGRNGGYLAPGMGEHDWEARLLIGRAFGGEGRTWLADGGFAEVQVARRFRQGLADETRIDATLALDVATNWQVQTQAFAGLSDAGPQWLHLETSAIRRLGDWSVQAGWRETVWGRETPVARGPVVAVWRRF